MPDEFSTSSDWESLSLFNSTGITLEANANSLISGKLPGRVGDSPLVGQVTDTIIIQGDDKTLEVIVQGVFADDLSVAVSCTGTGETFMRAGVARRAAYMVRIWYGDGGLFDMVTRNTTWKLKNITLCRSQERAAYIVYWYDQWSVITRDLLHFIICCHQMSKKDTGGGPRAQCAGGFWGGSRLHGGQVWTCTLVEIGSKQPQNSDIILIIATARRPGWDLHCCQNISWINTFFVW